MNRDTNHLDAANANANDGFQALRECAATALESALRFVESNGAALTRRRAAALVRAELPAAAVSEIAALQHPDGSFPRLPDHGFDVLAGAASAPFDGCLDALAALAELRALGTPCASRVVEFLRGAQADGGAWGDSGKTTEVGRLVATGLLAGTQARTPFARPKVLAAAAGFLARCWSPERVRGGDLGLLAAYADCYTNVRHELADEIQQWCGRELDRGFRSRRFSAAETAQVFIVCDVHALPGCGVSPVSLARALLEEQGADGGFGLPSKSGSGERAGSTLQAMFALIALCGSL